jgi:hypothetical protein
MAMNSHACLSGASLVDMHLTGYISQGMHLTGRASHWACISQDVHLIGVYLKGVHLSGMHLMGFDSRAKSLHLHVVSGVSTYLGREAKTSSGERRLDRIEWRWKWAYFTNPASKELPDYRNYNPQRRATDQSYRIRQV